MPRTYDDFELDISPSETHGYVISVVRSAAGSCSAPYSFPFDTAALEVRLKDLQIALLRSGGQRRRVPLPEEATVQEFGAALYDSLFAGDIRSAFEESRRVAADAGHGLRLRLRVQSPQLAALPWEFLYDRRLGDYLALAADAPIVRHLPLTGGAEPLAVQPPLRILGMIASPGNLPPIDVRAERATVEQSLRALIDSGLVDLEWVEGQSWRSLRQRVRAEVWHVVHFLGHGGFDPTAREGVLYFTDENNQAEALTALECNRVLSGCRSLRLVVLNACQGAQHDELDIFSSTAATLVRGGVPAVVAMQYEITDAAAKEFARSFYEAIVDGLPVDAAVAEARIAMSTDVSNSLEWGIPVLFMRSPDGRIFAVDRAAARPLPHPAPVAPQPAPTEPTPTPPQIPAPPAAAASVDQPTETADGASGEPEPESVPDTVQFGPGRSPWADTGRAVDSRFVMGPVHAAPQAALPPVEPRPNRKRAPWWVWALQALIVLGFLGWVGYANLILPYLEERAASDNDGLTDSQGMEMGTQSIGADTDGDGLQDVAEAEWGTDPTRIDTDGDGLTDSQETEREGLSPTKYDTDGDGLSDGQEIERYNTDPLDKDSDDDGLSDAGEIDLNIDPHNNDWDGDGLLDGDEVSHGANPRSPDSDSDGLKDGQELNEFGSDPLKRDSDADGLDDGDEVAFGTSLTDADSDGDGTSDFDAAATATAAAALPTRTPRPVQTPTPASSGIFTLPLPLDLILIQPDGGASSRLAATPTAGPDPSPTPIPQQNVIGEGLLWNWSRSGGRTLETVFVEDADPQLCLDACTDNSECAAWTLALFRNREGYGCRLTADAPPGSAQISSVSGLRETLLPEWTWNTLAEGDEFSRTAISDPVACAALCRADDQCVAWTYFKGACADEAVPLCGLFSTKTGLVYDTCHVSGQR